MTLPIAFARGLSLALFASLAVVTVTGSLACDGDEQGDDDDDDDGGEGEGEGGEGEGEGGEGEGEGEFPVTPDVRALCEIATRGQLNFAGAIAASVTASFAARCSAEDPGPAFPSPDEIAAAAAVLCADDSFENNQVFAEANAGGRVTFDVENIEACSALDLEALEASGAIEIPAPCNPTTLFAGTQGEGQVCAGEWECTGELRCEAANIHAQELTCLAPAAAGAPCVEGGISTDFGGLFENGQLAPRSCDEASQCVDFTCVARAGVGDPCESDECLEELRCDFDAVDPVCVARSDVGDPCTFDDDCVDDLACDGAGACAAPVADGASCNAGDPCEETCSTCRPLTPGGGALECQDRGAAGAACESDDDCRHNFVCDVGSNACVAAGAAGADCIGNDGCATGLVCGADDLCLAQPGLGDACAFETTTECADNTVCAAGECRAGAVGDVCDDDDDCISDDAVCLPGAGPAASTCGPAPTTGRCSVGGECAEGSVCEGKACVVAPDLGDPCTASGLCGEDAFCDGTTCLGKLGAGAVCTIDDECRGVCVDGQCSAEGASCLTSKGVFPIVVLLSGLLPLGRRWRRVTSALRR